MSWNRDNYNNRGRGNQQNYNQNPNYNQNQQNQWQQQQQPYGSQNPYAQQNPYGQPYQQQQWQNYEQQNQYQQQNYGGYGGHQQYGGQHDEYDRSAYQHPNHNQNNRRQNYHQSNQNNHNSRNTGYQQNRKPQQDKKTFSKSDPTKTPSAAQTRSPQPERVSKPVANKTEAIKKKLPQPEPTPQPKKVEKTKQVPVAAWDSESDEEVSPQPAKQVEKKATPAEETAEVPVAEEKPKEIAKEKTPEPTPVKSKKKSKKNANKKKVKAHDKREHLNIVFIGHVDAGKSTLSGQILLQTGQVDERTISKYEREAKEKNRESWWIAYIMDTSEEERAKGKTVECGRAHFETESKRYTILDAPGHKNYVPHMISGAAQADVACLVISARVNEFEAGFNRGGQTREHTRLAYTLGIKRLVIILNKMDCVDWSKKRRDEIITSVEPFAKSIGYKWKDVTIVPVSGQEGLNISSRLEDGVCSWYDGPCLLETLDNLKKIKRAKKKPLRIPVMDRYKEMGCIMCLGKIESSKLTVGDKIRVMPCNKIAQVVKLSVDEEEVEMAGTGENVIVGLKGISDDDVHGGDVLCDLDEYCPRATYIECQMELLELLEHKPLFSIGYSSIFHCHNLSVECECVEIPHKLQKKTGRKSKNPPKFLRGKECAVIRLKLKVPSCLEEYSVYPQLGRFNLRDEGKTIAIGRISKIMNESTLGKN